MLENTRVNSGIKWFIQWFTGVYNTWVYNLVPTRLMGIEGLKWTFKGEYGMYGRLYGILGDYMVP